MDSRHQEKILLKFNLVSKIIAIGLLLITGSCNTKKQNLKSNWLLGIWIPEKIEWTSYSPDSNSRYFDGFFTTYGFSKKC